MPYVITTTEERAHYERRRAVNPDAYRSERTTVRAVATLEEVDPYVSGLVSAVIPWPSATEASHAAAAQLRELIALEGGTVGPLPDGTVIEVRAVETTELYDALPVLERDGLATARVSKIIDAYNAAQEKGQERPQTPRPTVVALGVTVTVPDGANSQDVRAALLQTGWDAARGIEAAYPSTVTTVRVTHP